MFHFEFLHVQLIIEQLAENGTGVVAIMDSRHDLKASGNTNSDEVKLFPLRPFALLASQASTMLIEIGQTAQVIVYDLLHISSIPWCLTTNSNHGI